MTVAEPAPALDAAASRGTCFILDLAMNRSLAMFRRIRARWALLPSVLLLLALVIGGAHSHAREAAPIPVRSAR
jgi:hypothetical protein